MYIFKLPNPMRGYKRLLMVCYDQEVDNIVGMAKTIFGNI
jgi:hypothetical protein